MGKRGTGEGARSALARLHEQEHMRSNLSTLLEDVNDAPRDKHCEPQARN